MPFFILVVFLQIFNATNLYYLLITYNMYPSCGDFKSRMTDLFTVGVQIAIMLLLCVSCRTHAWSKEYATHIFLLLCIIFKNMFIVFA